MPRFLKCIWKILKTQNIAHHLGGTSGKNEYQNANIYLWIHALEGAEDVDTPGKFRKTLCTTFCAINVSLKLYVNQLLVNHLLNAMVSTI